MEEFYVYMHIKETTGEPFYVGKGKNNRAASFKGRSKHWNSIVNKHGFDVIFLETDLTEQKAFDREVYWIERIGRKDLGLGPLVNFTDGGEGITNVNPKTKKMFSDKMKLNNPMFNKEVRDKVSLTNTGKITPENIKQKIKSTMIGKNKGYENGNFGDKSKTSKLVINLQTGIIHDSIKEASLVYNIKYRTLSGYLNGERKNKTTLKFI